MKQDIMNKGKWFKLPPNITKETYTFIIQERQHGKKSRKGIKKKTSKKSG